MKTAKRHATKKKHFNSSVATYIDEDKSNSFSKNFASEFLLWFRRRKERNDVLRVSRGYNSNERDCNLFGGLAFN